MNNARANPEVADRTILVVEDEVLIRMLICDVLRDCGLRVVEAVNADEALEYVRTDPTVDLVFSDVRMPGSMDGLALARMLRAEFPRIDVVLTSGHLLASEVGREIILLTKPYPVAETAARLIAIVDGKRSAE